MLDSRGSGIRLVASRPVPAGDCRIRPEQVHAVKQYANATTTAILLRWDMQAYPFIFQVIISNRKDNVNMKKQIKVVGLQHKKGISSNTNEPYDFYVMHATYNDPNTEGICCLSVTVPDREVPSIVIGEEVTFFSHFYKKKEIYDAIYR